MLIESFTVGALATNCYIVGSEETKEAIVIDPGFDYRSEAQSIFNYLQKQQLKLKFIVNTHGHEDHVNGDAVFQEKYAVPICIHRLDAFFLETLQTANAPATVLLDEGSKIQFGNEILKVLQTPGHTAGSICLIGDKVLFSGDTLFASSIGRTDFEEGNPKDMQASLQKIKQLPDNLIVYPGHGPSTLLGQEKRVNPFLTGRFMF